MHFLLVFLSTCCLAAVSTFQVNKRTEKFLWFGVNESGAEFGSSNLPGVEGTDYTWPSESSIQKHISEGYNIFRINVLMERLVPDELSGSLASTYFSQLESLVSYVTGQGAYAVISPHNFGRYYGNIITDTTGFHNFWETVAAPFKSNNLVVFDTNNEYHDMDQTLVFNLNQAAINGVRAAGAISQFVFVEGNAYTGASSWTSTNDNLKDLADPYGKIVYEMHQYLDSDGSGTSETCVSSTVGVERITSATQWLVNNDKNGIMGEFAGGPNSVCAAAVEGMVEYMAQYNGYWRGAMWWAGGPWWADYFFSFEPPSGTAYLYYDSALKDLY